MSVRQRFVLAALATSLSTLCAPSSQAADPVTCWMNNRQQTCTTKPWGKGGFEISFSGSAIYRFVPVGPPTTDKRRMRDEQGQIWLMSGHHSFTLEEQSQFHNRIMVSNVPGGGGTGTANHQAHSKVKLNGHGQSTVTLYSRPDFGAPIGGMGVSGEVLDKLGCQTSSALTWCRVGYSGQSGRELWVPTGSLLFLGDGE